MKFVFRLPDDHSTGSLRGPERGTLTRHLYTLAMPDAQPTLDEQAVRHIAKLARLALTDAQVSEYRGQLAGVLDYVRTLEKLELDGVEPLTHVGESANAFREDIPCEHLPNEVLMQLAPATMPPFVRIPKVIGDGGGA